MKTVIVPSGASPFVAFRLAFASGSANDPPGKEGLAALTGALLAEGGTRSLTHEAVLEVLYPMAAGLGVQVERDMTVLHGTVHRDHLERYYALLRESLLAPRFEARELARIQDDQHNAIASGLRAGDDEALGQESLASVIHPGLPYGRPVEGTIAGIASLTRDDVVGFHRDHLTKSRMTLGLAGPVTDRFVAQVESDFQELPAGPPPPPLPSGVGRRPAGMDLLVVTKPARACAISLGHALPVTRADDDFIPLLVASSYLGEHRTFHGVLMEKIRTQRGLNYGDYSYVEHFIQDGASTFSVPNIPRRRQAFTIWIRPVSPDHAHFAIRLAVRELRRLVRDGLPREEFERTREFLLHYSKLWVQTPSRRLGYAMDGTFYGRAGLVDELAVRLPSLKVEDVNAAIRRHLAPDDLAIAVVADPEAAPAFVAALAGNEPSPVAYGTETQSDVLAEDREVAIEPLTIDRARCRIVPAEDMFER